MGNDLPVCREFEKMTDSTVHTKIWSLCYLVILKSVVDGTTKYSPSLFYSFFFSFLSLNILNSGIMCYFVSFSGASRHIFLLRVRQPLFQSLCWALYLKKQKKTITQGWCQPINIRQEHEQVFQVWNYSFKFTSILPDLSNCHICSGNNLQCVVWRYTLSNAI